MAKQPLTENQKIVHNDILRYKKNKFAAALALLGLVFNCLYFMILYAMPDAHFTTVTIGLSVIITLLVLLFIFFSSEGVKGYNKKFSIVLLIIAVVQIARIFYYPLNGVMNNWLIQADADHTIGYFGIYPTSSGLFFALMVIYLAASAACLVAAAVIGWIYAVRLEKFQKQLDSGEIDLNAALKDIDESQSNIKVKAQPVDTTQEVQ